MTEISFIIWGSNLCLLDDQVGVPKNSLRKFVDKNSIAFGTGTVKNDSGSNRGHLKMLMDQNLSVC